MLMSLLLISACQTTPSEQPVGNASPKPKLFIYGHAFDQIMLAEVQTLAPPCDRDIPVKPCSALNRVRLDDQYTRDQLRQSGIQPTP
jgi:hypothetical protein